MGYSSWLATCVDLGLGFHRPGRRTPVSETLALNCYRTDPVGW